MLFWRCPHAKGRRREGDGESYSQRGRESPRVKAKLDVWDVVPHQTGETCYTYDWDTLVARSDTGGEWILKKWVLRIVYGAVNSVPIGVEKLKSTICFEDVLGVGSLFLAIGFNRSTVHVP